MEENLITWNVSNWITVVLMAAIAFAILGVIKKWYAGRQAAQ
jgi:hypothetical protein